FSEGTVTLFEELLNDALKADSQSELELFCMRQISFCYNTMLNRAKTIHWLKRVLEHAEKKNIPSFVDYAHDVSLLANHYVNIGYLDSALLTQNKMEA